MQQTINDLDTPSLIVDLDIMERNLQKYHSYAKQHNLQLWPHTKTHKTPELAKLQIKHGSPGVTCAKIGEAEVMAANGIERVLIAYPVVGPQKMARLITLAKKNTLASRREAIAWLMVRFNSLSPKEARAAKQGDTSAYNNDRKVIEKLFNVLGPRFQSRQGGYTRILKLPDHRAGDNTQTCLLSYLED